MGRGATDNIYIEGNVKALGSGFGFDAWENGAASAVSAAVSREQAPLEPTTTMLINCLHVTSLSLWSVFQAIEEQASSHHRCKPNHCALIDSAQRERGDTEKRVSTVTAIVVARTQDDRKLFQYRDVCNNVP